MLKVNVIRDFEGQGVCGECGREGLRWVAELSDGSYVGLECAKKLIGFKPAIKDYNWVADYVEVARYVECEGTQYETVHTLYAHKKNAALTVSATRGRLTQVGGARADWERRGRI